MRSTLITDDKGKITVDGLGNGRYFLVETKAYEGYNLLSQPVEVTLNVSTVTEYTRTTTTNAEGVTTSTESKTTTTFDNDPSKTGTYTITIENNKRI